MAEVNPPVFLQAGSHGAEGVRRALQTLLSTAGIFGASDLVVTENGTPGMNVKVASGRAIVTGTEDSAQAVYFVDNQGDVVLTISASDPTNDRIDLVVARVKDAEYSGAVNSWALEVVTGTPAGSPSPPAVPNNSLVLAQVLVNNGATSIVNADITDKRTTQSGQNRATALGGVVVCTSTTHPTVTEGAVIYETDTDKVMTYNGSAWVPPKNVAQGIIAYAEITATPSTSASSTPADIAGLSVSPTLVSGRTYKCTVFFRGCQSSVNADDVQVVIDINGNDEADVILDVSDTSSARGGTSVVAKYTAGASSAITFKAQLARFGGTGNVTIGAAATSPAFIMVEDCGALV